MSLGFSGPARCLDCFWTVLPEDAAHEYASSIPLGFPVPCPGLRPHPDVLVGGAYEWIEKGCSCAPPIRMTVQGQPKPQAGEFKRIEEAYSCAARGEPFRDSLSARQGTLKPRGT